jgi:hypothetical protein
MITDFWEDLSGRIMERPTTMRSLILAYDEWCDIFQRSRPTIGMFFIRESGLAALMVTNRNLVGGGMMFQATRDQHTSWSPHRIGMLAQYMGSDCGEILRRTLGLRINGAARFEALCKAVQMPDIPAAIAGLHDARDWSRCRDDVRDGEARALKIRQQNEIAMALVSAEAVKTKARQRLAEELDDLARLGTAFASW